MLFELSKNHSNRQVMQIALLAAYSYGKYGEIPNCICETENDKQSNSHKLYCEYGAVLELQTLLEGK